MRTVAPKLDNNHYLNDVKSLQTRDYISIYEKKIHICNVNI